MKLGLAEVIALAAFMFSLFSLYVTSYWRSFKFAARLANIHHRKTVTSGSIKRERIVELVASSLGNQAVYIDALFVRKSTGRVDSAKYFPVKAYIPCRTTCLVSVDIVSVYFQKGECYEMSFDLYMPDTSKLVVKDTFLVTDINSDGVVSFSKMPRFRANLHSFSWLTNYQKWKAVKRN